MAYCLHHRIRASRFSWMRCLWPLLVAAATLFPLGASAQLAAVTTQAANMRAGPDRTFPLVTWLPPGTSVDVMGCIGGWRWCDVVYGPNRGWVYARFLSAMYNNQPMVILDSGGMLGLPVIGFSVDAYWGSYYRNRPWWNKRTYWASRPPTWQHPPSRPPAAHPARPTPAPHGGRPPQGGKPPSEGRPPHGAKPASEVNAQHGGKPAGAGAPSHSRPPSNGKPSSEGHNARPSEGRQNGHPPSSETKPAHDDNSKSKEKNE